MSVMPWIDAIGAEQDCHIFDFFDLGSWAFNLHQFTFNKAYPLSKRTLEEGCLQGKFYDDYLNEIEREITTSSTNGGFTLKDKLSEWIRARVDFLIESGERANIFSICHNDLHPQNVMKSKYEHRLYVVDWDNCVISDPILDFVKPFYWCAYDNEGLYRHSDDIFSAFCNGYFSRNHKRTLACPDELAREVIADPSFQLHCMLWLFRVWTFERQREKEAALQPAPFPSSATYYGYILRLLNLNSSDFCREPRGVLIRWKEIIIAMRTSTIHSQHSHFGQSKLGVLEFEIRTTRRQ
jgi:hypothetical protein